MAGEMNQDLAQRLFDEGAVFMFLDVPPGTEFGIDMNTWNVGENFKGVKMIPPGLHFIYFSAVSKEGSTAPRTGFFHFFEKSEILVRYYSVKEEQISDQRATDEELERFRMNKKDMDRFLGAYPYESWKQWVSLTNHITREVLEKIQPLCGTVASAAQLVAKPEEPTDEESPRKRHCGSGVARTEEELLPHLICVPGTEVRWAQWPTRPYPEGATPQEISRHSLDTSYQLETLAGTEPSGWHDVLGELQFAFVVFLVAQAYDGFERWKRLINVICRSERALQDRPGFFLDFMTVLHFQIKLVPEDFFADIVSNSNFLVDSLRRFFPNVEECGKGANDPLVKRAKKFKEHLQEKFEWDFEEEAEDEQPVIVET